MRWLVSLEAITASLGEAGVPGATSAEVGAVTEVFMLLSELVLR